MSHGGSGWLGGGPLPVGALGAEYVALVWKCFQGVLASCCIVVNICFLCVEWDGCYVVIGEQEKRSWSRRWGYCPDASYREVRR